MSAGNSKIAIYSAIGANFLISIMKFVATSFTGSSAMLSEGIHSLIDTFNGVLLLYGIKKSNRPPTDEHPFGFGKEVYFWSFIVAIFIFALGGGIAIYEGIQHIIHPHAAEPGMVIWNYGVLIGAIVFESISFTLAFREFRKANPSGFISSIRKSKDAATFAVIIEDSAALTGLVIALLGVIISQVTGNPVYDGIASVGIGILLAGVALFLAYETKGLLVGESASKEDLSIIDEVMLKYENVKHYGNIKSMHLGPDKVILAYDVNFYDHVSAGEIEDCIEEIEKRITDKVPKFDTIYIEVNSIKPSPAK